MHCRIDHELPVGGAENRIRNARACGTENPPFHTFSHNEAWLEPVLIALDLLAWTERILLHDTILAERGARSRRRCATGCCSSPGGPLITAAKRRCGSREPGPGATSSALAARGLAALLAA